MDMIDKNYIKILSFAALLFSSAPLSAQTILDDPEDDEEEVDSLFVPIEDEISVIDKQGNTEFIDFPEAMTYNLDSIQRYRAAIHRPIHGASASLSKLHAGSNKLLCTHLRRGTRGISGST